MPEHKYKVGDTFTLVISPRCGIDDYGISENEFGKVLTISKLVYRNVSVPLYITEGGDDDWHVYEDMMADVQQVEGPW